MNIKKTLSIITIVAIVACSPVINVEAKSASDRIENHIIDTGDIKLDNYDYSVLASTFDAKYYAEHNPDVVAAVGIDEKALYAHYLNSGIMELRGGSSETDISNLEFVPAYTISVADGINTIDTIYVCIGKNGGIGIYTGYNGTTKPNRLILSTYDYVEIEGIQNDALIRGDKIITMRQVGPQSANSVAESHANNISNTGNYMYELLALPYFVRTISFSKTNSSKSGIDGWFYTELDPNGLSTTQYTVSVALTNYNEKSAVLVYKWTADNGYEHIDYCILENRWSNLMQDYKGEAF